MKCQKCGKNEANTHVKRVINGEFEEYDLCPECAAEMGYGNIFGNIAEEFNSMFRGFFENALPARTQATRCETCGSSYADIARTGMIGCADCYDVFEDRIMPTVRRIHGNTAHCGKKSVVAGIEVEEVEEKEQTELEKLKAELDNAVKDQEFEKAAQLRDEIKALEENDE